ncbi:MAG: hypothetical protein M1536_00830, partial [Firmicutes bacterium]|nr:hypothetical protein [Bacillota bacterium]
MIFKIKKSARNLLAFLSLSLVFLLIFLSTFLAYGETLIEANVQDTFYISPDGITIEKQIEHCGRLGVDIREKLLKASNKNEAAAGISNNQLPSQKQLDDFSN